jgi:hypothetical protein
MYRKKCITSIFIIYYCLLYLNILKYNAIQNKYHTLKSSKIQSTNRRNRVKIDHPNTHIHDHRHFNKTWRSLIA